MLVELVAVRQPCHVVFVILMLFICEMCVVLLIAEQDCSPQIKGSIDAITKELATVDSLKTELVLTGEKTLAPTDQKEEASFSTDNKEAEPAPCDSD